MVDIISWSEMISSKCDLAENRPYAQNTVAVSNGFRYHRHVTDGRRNLKDRMAMY